MTLLRMRSWGWKGFIHVNSGAAPHRSVYWGELHA